MILHSGAYFRDASFATWHDFSTTRALENQVFFLSLNRAGQHYGNSRLCLPWMDETHLGVKFPEHAERLINLVIDPAEIAAARQAYSFLKDRLPSYRGL
jgi:predicted amidohydrolase